MQNNLKLENVQVTHPNNNPKPNLDYDLLTSRSIKCRILDMDYMSTNFGVDNSSYLFFRARTDRHPRTTGADNWSFVALRLLTGCADRGTCVACDTIQVKYRYTSLYCTYQSVSERRATAYTFFKRTWYDHACFV